MQTKDEMIIRISSEGNIYVEHVENGIKGFKRINPETFIKCIGKSVNVGAVSSGILPMGTFFYGKRTDGTCTVCLEFPQRYCDISYMKTEYPAFPLPRLVFGFILEGERIRQVNLGVAQEGMLTPRTKMFEYPFSNVNEFKLCCGANSLPHITSLHQLTGVMHFIMSMPNNNDHYHTERTKLELELRHLFETLKDKDTAYYYSEVLLDSGKTLEQFVNA